MQSLETLLRNQTLSDAMQGECLGHRVSLWNNANPPASEETAREGQRIFQHHLHT